MAGPISQIGLPQNPMARFGLPRPFWATQELHTAQRVVLQTLPADATAAVAVLAVLLLALCVWHLFFTSTNRLPLPPGPRGWPIIGNLGQLSERSPQLDYIKWGNELGESLSIWRVVSE
jgi:hypothetical protein